MAAAINGFKYTEISPGFGAEICGFDAAKGMTEENFRCLQDIVTTVGGLCGSSTTQAQAGNPVTLTPSMVVRGGDYS